MRVRELLPGMVHKLGDRTGTVICVTSHPIWSKFFLIVWKLSDDTMSFDALLPQQELPSEWIGQTPTQMQEAWKQAIGLKHG
jgi:hypothetical protein